MAARWACAGQRQPYGYAPVSIVAGQLAAPVAAAWLPDPNLASPNLGGLAELRAWLASTSLERPVCGGPPICLALADGLPAANCLL